MTTEEKSKTKNVPEGMLTYDEAAEKLGSGRRTLERYVADGKIPEAAMYCTPGRRLFREAELEKILEGGGIK